MTGICWEWGRWTFQATVMFLVSFYFSVKIFLMTLERVIACSLSRPWVDKCNNESLNYSKVFKFVFITLYACSFAINLTNHALILAQAYSYHYLFFCKIKFASSQLYSGRLKTFCFHVSRASGWDIVPTQVMQAFVWFAFVGLYD